MAPTFFYQLEEFVNDFQAKIITYDLYDFSSREIMRKGNYFGEFRSACNSGQGGGVVYIFNAPYVAAPLPREITGKALNPTRGNSISFSIR